MTRKSRLATTALAAISAAAILSPPAFANKPGDDPFKVRATDMPPTTGLPTGGGASADNSAAGEDNEALNPQCAAFQADRDADVGEILRAGCEPTLAQMSALMDNPLGNVAMLFTQFDLYQLKDPNTGRTEDKYNYMGIAQFPKSLGDDWNLINRIVWNVPSMPLDQNKIDHGERAAALLGDFQGAVVPPAGSPIAPIDLFGGRTTGFGDMYYVGLFSPKKPNECGNGKCLWGLGFDVMFPTASEEILGTGKWAAGPSALAVYLGPKWKLGTLIQQYWDFAGDRDRDNVNLMNMQYFYMYSLNETTSIGAAPNIIGNFEQSSGNKWTLPVGLGINKTINIGKVPVRFGLEAYYSVVKPDDVVGTEWDFRFYMIPAAPSALFSWMQ